MGNSGNIELFGGGTEAGGFSAARGHAKLFGGTFNFNAGSSVSGAGSANFSATAVNFNASSTLTNGDEQHHHRDGGHWPMGVRRDPKAHEPERWDADGCSTLTIPGCLTWTGGTMSGTASNANECLRIISKPDRPGDTL